MNKRRQAVRDRLEILSTPKFRRFLHKGVWGLADHALMSATNFVTMVLLARVLTPRDFGLYALTYTTLIFLSGVQSALISQPHTMLGSPRSGAQFVRYTTGSAMSQAALAVATAAIIALLALVVSRFDAQASRLLFACAPATAAWQMQEFVRRVLYTRTHVIKVFANDLVSYGGQLVLIVLFWQMSILGPVSALTALTVTSAIGALLGIWQIWPYLGKLPSWSEFATTAAENWNFGKWLLGGSLAQWTSARVYPLLAAGLVSVAATGVVKATQTLVGPTHILMYAIDPLVGPKSAKVYAGGGAPALRALIVKVQLLVLVTIGGYCLLVAVLAKPLLNVVYGPEYGQYAWLLSSIAIVTIFKTLRSPLRLALSAVGETSALFRLRLASSVANLTVGLAAVYFFGLPGIAFGLIMDEFIMQIIMWRFYLRYTGGGTPLSTLRHLVNSPETSITATSSGGAVQALHMTEREQS